MKSYRDLDVWQKSFGLAENVYLLAKKLPKSELFGLISQIQRSAVSIPSNIAEGQQRNSIKEFCQFLAIARGSTAELITQLELIAKIYNIDCDNLVSEANEIGKMLYALQKKIGSN